MSSIFSSEFVAMTHHANLGNWLTRYDDTPSGMIVAKIFRELDLAKSSDFISGLFQLIAEVGLPRNVELALIYYIGTLKEKIPQKNISELKQSVLQATPKEVLATVPKSILELL